MSGAELTQAAMLQAVKFGTRLVSPRSVTGVSRVPGGLRVRLDDEYDIVAFEVRDLQAAVDWAAAGGYRVVGGIGEYEGAWRMA